MLIHQPQKQYIWYNNPAVGPQRPLWPGATRHGPRGLRRLPTRYADEAGGVEGLVVGGGGAHGGAVDGEVGARALHVPPTILHHPADLLLRQPAGGVTRGSRRRRRREKKKGKREEEKKEEKKKTEKKE